MKDELGRIFNDQKIDWVMTKNLQLFKRQQ